MSTVDNYADVRTGDKGDTLILSVLAHDEESFVLLVDYLTADIVAEHYSLPMCGPVTRRLAASTRALVFTLTGALGGGVTGSPVLDGHGKALSYHLLTLELNHR